MDDGFSLNLSGVHAFMGFYYNNSESLYMSERYTKAQSLSGYGSNTNYLSTGSPGYGKRGGRKH